MAKELPKRSEVRVEDTWAVEDIYPNLQAWEKDLEAAKEIGAKLASCQGKIGESAAQLLEAFRLYEEGRKKLSLTGNYASRCSDVDTKNTENQALTQKVQSVSVRIGSQIAFLEPEVLALEETVLEQFYQEEPALRDYEIAIKEIRRQKAHRLSAEMEMLLASAGEVTSTPSSVFAMFNNADVQFPEIEDENGETVRITHGRFRPLEESGDRRVRKDAFEGLYHTYDQYKNTLAAAYSGQVKQLMFLAKARNYASTLEAAVDRNNVSPTVYHNLVEVINENMDKMHHYVRLRKQCLGVDELHMYDVYVPMISEVTKEIPFEEAKKTVLTALAPLGERYISLLKEGFEHRWLDVYENEGKRSGAYSAGAYGVHPFVLLNYNNTLDAQFTLAHEMGHSLHSYFSNEKQSFLNAGYKIFVAEVASTCNEILLMEYLLAHTEDKKERAYLIDYYMDCFKSTVYRQTMFAEFEMLTNAMAERGESLTADALNKVYWDLNKKYFGPDMISDPEIALEWARIPHFYYNFYVYQYATGFSAAVAIARRILKEGEPAVADYMKFLSSGCTDAPVELLKIAGVDMTTKEPIQAAMDVFGELLEEMETLL
ncbi:MAG: oligoendopeptidase F [Lachnospiraceae bacterium]|jgi:oligoendopeptidase F|nr:oligoendopeptidase F [Lachnospiraceae bacterium]